MKSERNVRLGDLGTGGSTGPGHGGDFRLFGMANSWRALYSRPGEDGPSYKLPGMGVSEASCCRFPVTSALQLTAFIVL